MRSDITKSLLQELYTERGMTPYQIAEALSCNHKTIRNRLKAFGIPLRVASEYNYLPRKTHVSPSQQLLYSHLSVAGHIAYLCEGYHTEKAASFYFCNTEASLIDLMIRFLREIYQVSKFRLVILASSEYEAKPLLHLYPQAKLYIETDRVTPIVRVWSGGRVLVREVVENGYQLLSDLS